MDKLLRASAESQEFRVMGLHLGCKQPLAPRHNSKQEGNIITITNNGSIDETKKT